MVRERRLLVGVVVLTAAASAQGAMRCGTELITEGESVVKLLEHCGEPAIGDPTLYYGTTEWTYNFGPDEFMMRVIIRDGRVERIEELAWGVERPVGEPEDLEPEETWE